MQIRKIVSPDAGTVEIITKWMYSWWGERENYSFDAVKEYISHSFNESTLPITFGLYDEDELIGMYQITYSDLFVLFFLILRIPLRLLFLQYHFLLRRVRSQFGTDFHHK